MTKKTKDDDLQVAIREIEKSFDLFLVKCDEETVPSLERNRLLAKSRKLMRSSLSALRKAIEL